MGDMDELSAEPDHSSFNATGMDANDTLRCAARYIQGPLEVSFNPIVPIVARSVLVIYFMLVCIFGTLLNGFTLYIICRYKKLRTVSFVFVVQIVVADLFRSFLLVSPSLYSVLVDKWVFGEVVCIATGAFHTACTVLRSILIFGLVVDRFCSVFCAFKYHKYQVKFLWCFNTVAYIIAFIVIILAGVADCYSFSSVTFSCRILSTCSSQCAILRQGLGIFLFLPLSVLDVALYFCLFNKGRKARKAMSISMGTTASASDVHKAKKEWRATITFFLMFLAFFLCNVPPGLLGLTITITGLTSNSTESLWYYVLDCISNNLFISNNLATPIFVVRNRDVREIITEINWIPFLKVKTKKNVTSAAIPRRSLSTANTRL